jgi:hypothetical protein
MWLDFNKHARRSCTAVGGLQALRAAAEEYETDYLPDLRERIAATERKKQEARDKELAKLMTDVRLTQSGTAQNGSGT